jgi:hypothetical protein
MFAKVICRFVMYHLIYCSVLVNEQSGFMKNLSIDEATYKYEILKDLNNKIHVAGIFCDLGRAFDFTDKIILLRIRLKCRQMV